MNKQSRALLLALVGTGLSAAVAPAAVESNNRGAAPSVATDPSSATTQPAAPGGGRPVPMPLPLPMQGDQRFRYSMITPTAEQISAMEKFVQEHCPNRFKAYQNFTAPIGPMGNGRERLQRALVRGYLELQILEAEDSDMFGLKVQQMELQDKVFGMVADAREGGRDTDYTKVRSDLRPLEEQLRANRRQQAALRVQRLSDALEREKQTLGSLEGSGANDVAKAVEDDVHYGGRILWGGPWGPGGPGPGGGGGGGGFGRPFGGRGGGGPTTEPSRRGP